MAVDLKSVPIGYELRPIIFGPYTRQTLADFARASGDLNPIHTDPDFARAAGFDDVFAHGMLSMALLSRVVTGWAGLDRLISIETRFLQIVPLGTVARFKGRTTDRFPAGEGERIRISLIAEFADGKRFLEGSAIVAV